MNKSTMINQILGRSFSPFAHRLFPDICPACRQNILSSFPLCHDCRTKLPLILPPYCPACGGENDGALEICANCLRMPERPWSKAVAVFRMERFGRKLIHRYKYRGETELARPFSSLAAEACRREKLSPEIICPMPLHWIRQLQRGYNQSMLFANLLGRELQVPVEEIVIRKQRTPQQARLGRKERLKSQRHAFCVPKPAFCKKRTILLVDDVLTTGATMAAAADSLLAAGAGDVQILILARD